jgi:hypothetical protein
MTVAAVLTATKVAAALAFLLVVLAIGTAYRVLTRRLEAARAEAVIEAEFARLDADPKATEPTRPSRTSSSTRAGFA